MNHVDRIGVYKVASIVSEKLGYIFREQPTDDYGIDAHIEIFSNNGATGKLIAVQIKSGKSYFKEFKNGSYVYRGNERHYRYWTNHSLPVIIVLYNPDTKECIWEEIKQEKIKILPSNEWKININKDNKLDENSKAKLKKIADNITEYERRFNSLVLSKSFMKEINDGNTIVIESSEWVNKSSGIGSINLKVIDQFTEMERLALNWPVTYFPIQCYQDVFQNLFPWANISIDEEFYAEYDEQAFLEECCPYDSEEGEYIYIEEFYEDWRDEQAEIRPYTNHSGEVDEYRLRLTLNDLGKSFLNVDRYLERNL